MILKELINKHNWTEIESLFCDFYPKMKASLPGYKKVFEKLNVTLPTNGTFEIILEIFEEDGETEVHVNAKNKALIDGKPDLMSYSLMLTTWPEWLAMSIDAKCVRDFSELEIIIHCLWEMTFCGYEEESIQELESKLEQEAEEINSLSPEELKTKFTSLDELKGKFGMSNIDDEY